MFNIFFLKYYSVFKKKFKRDLEKNILPFSLLKEEWKKVYKIYLNNPIASTSHMTTRCR